MQPLHAVLLRNELRSQPVEQLGMGWLSTQHAEIIRSAVETSAEVPLPDSIHCHPREQRIIRSGQPVHEHLAPSVPQLRFRERKGKSAAPAGNMGVSDRPSSARNSLRSPLRIFFHRPINGKGSGAFNALICFK